MSIDGAAISRVVVYVMSLAVPALHTCRVTARNVRDNLRLILVPLAAGIVMLAVTCEGIRGP